MFFNLLPVLYNFISRSSIHSKWIELQKQILNTSKLIKLKTITYNYGLLVAPLKFIYVELLNSYFSSCIVVNASTSIEKGVHSSEAVGSLKNIDF